MVEPGRETGGAQVYTEIKNKFGLGLRKCKETGSYELNFVVTNPHYALQQVFEKNIFELLASFNPDIIEGLGAGAGLEQGEALFYLKSISDDFGIGKKYINLGYQSAWSKTRHVLTYKSSSMPVSGPVVRNGKTYEKITCHYLDTVIEFVNAHTAQFIVSFSVNLHEELPIYMKNVEGVLMARMFGNLKTFIENMKPQ
jgi:hypothetical protein